MRVFEIDPELKVVDVEGELIDSLDDRVHDFFKEHIYNSLIHKNTKEVRFKINNTDTVNNCQACFNEETFADSSRNIAGSLATNIHSNVTNNFHLIIAVYQVDTDDWFLDNNENVLAILKMETNQGVQMENGEFRIQPNMLPDLGNQLQKCAFVIKSFVENFEDNNQNLGYHSRILDKQDTTVSNYFMNLLDSAVVADDGESSKLAQQFISKNVKKYVETEQDQVNVDRNLGIIFSRRNRTSIDAIVTELERHISLEKLEQAGLTIDGLSDDILLKIRQKNPSARNEFESIPYKPAKLILKNDDHSVMISIEKALIEDDIIEIQGPQDINRNYTIKIPENLVTSDQ
jgi:hypothetical protein